MSELCEMVFILDRSGSMGGLESDTIGGFNGMIDKQRKDDVKAQVSVALFDQELEIPFDRITLLCRPDAPEAMPYRKGGSVKVKKEDYTSYREDVPYYTMIVRDEPKPLKLLLDLTPDAIRRIRRWNREAVRAEIPA